MQEIIGWERHSTQLYTLMSYRSRLVYRWNLSCFLSLFIFIVSRHPAFLLGCYACARYRACVCVCERVRACVHAHVFIYTRRTLVRPNGGKNVQHNNGTVVTVHRRSVLSVINRTNPLDPDSAVYILGFDISYRAPISQEAHLMGRLSGTSRVSSTFNVCTCE